MAPIYKASSLNICDIAVSKVNKNKQGGNTVYLNFKGNKIVIQGPEMYSPFGLSEYSSEKGLKYSLDLSFIDKEDNERVTEFYTFCKDLDKFMIKYAHIKSVEWFGKQQPMEVIEEFYRPLVKQGKPNKDKPGSLYPDTVKFKLRTRNDVLNVEMYDTEQNKLSVEDPIKPGSKIRCIFEISPVWFINKKNFGVTFNCIQMQIAKPNKIEGFCFIDEED
jgi:hypothetical protein